MGSTKPMAPVARQMVLACLTDPTSQGNLYTEVLLHQYRGQIDNNRLQAAFQGLVDRHEAVRTTFSADGGELSTQVQPAGSVQAQLEVVQMVSSDPNSVEVKEVLNKIARRSFDLSKAPLVRLAVVHTSGDRHLLLFCYCHCVMDGGSQGVWLRELETLYRGDDLPPLLHQYSDFAAWEEQILAEGTELVTKQLGYWKEQLRGAPELLELPTDYNRPPNSSFLGRVITFSVPANIHLRLLVFMGRERQSLFRVMLSALAITLSKYSQQNDVVVTVPRSLREQKMEGVLGHFINLLPVRLDLENELPFVEVVRTVGQKVKEAVASGDVTFESIVNECCTSRSAGYAPIAQASITVHEKGKYNAERE